VTVAEVIDLVLGSKDSGRKGFDTMTPTRYGHLVELLGQGVDARTAFAAEQRICASAWLKKPAREVTDEDMAKLDRERPWMKERR
jgi:hypothetical protein